MLSLAVVLAAAGVALAGGRQESPRGTADDWPLSCGYAPFLAGALGGPTGAEQEDHPSAAALRRFLKSGYIGYEFPDVGKLRLLSRDSELAQYSAGNPTRGGVAVVAFEGPAEGESKWDLLGLSGSCRPESLQEGFNVAEWKLPRGADSNPPPETDAIRALVRERSCASGSNPTKRLADPVISYGTRRIVVVVRARPRKGEFQTCQGNPWVPFKIELDEPIGSRTVVDGGLFPFGPRLNAR